MIVLSDIGITFNKGTPLQMQALRGVNISIPKGQFVTMIGSNGAGKSTLLNIVSGELVPDSGRVMLDDTDVTNWPIHARAPMISRMFQDPRSGICEQMSILENIAIASGRTSPRGFRFAITEALRKRAAERLAILGLGLEKRLDDRVALLSGGQRQALSLIMATFGSAKILLLDEHTAALDPGAADLVMRLTDSVVRQFEITTVMVTHSMRQALDFGSRIVMLHQGSIILDISGADRASVTLDNLLDLFRRKEGKELVDDQLLLG
ncbi:MAG TPA: ABC transporter ATP-binding protein [Pseudolabrys sp.]|nr:ABC transporter ATP-binding protein [Pseudolabrys sp.]